ncbi:hypothetical protein E2C01_039707 [Portunus trituberculatus]|uniref:Uncharacterized protein n=1 Tax=Portunus trituberculatus TaxID=210409 RepID=A0A5B7FEH4_PORTR|nr:hypothetical protein [Portunus trituberculatus]
MSSLCNGEDWLGDQQATEMRVLDKHSDHLSSFIGKPTEIQVRHVLTAKLLPRNWVTPRPSCGDRLSRAAPQMPEVDILELPPQQAKNPG